MSVSAGSDLIFSVTVTDSAGADVNFSSATEAIFKFSSKNAFITKTKTDNEVNEGTNANNFDVELQDTETKKLGKGKVTVEISLTLANADFSDGEATSVIYSEFTLI